MNSDTKQLVLISGFLMTIFSSLDLKAQKNDSISIFQKNRKLEEVVVTAQFGPQSIKESVYQVRSVNSEKIRLRGATNVQQVLNTEFGFRFTNDLALGTTDFEMMGMSGRNIKILLDGVPLVDRSDIRESLNQIDINSVDRIEIVEGPVSVVYGTDALAGVINIITKSAGKSTLGISARIQDETAGNEYGVLKGKGLHHQNINANWERNGWSALAGISHNDFGGWNLAPKTATIAEVSSMTNRWKPKEQFMGNSKVGYRNDNFNIWYRLDGLLEEIETRSGINPNNYRGELQAYTTNRYGQQLQSEWRLSKKIQITGVAGYTNLKRSTKTLIHDYTTNSNILSTEAGKQDVAKFEASILRATGIWKATDGVSIQSGIEYNRDAANGARIKGDPTINDYAFFISSEIKPASGLNFRPGLRFIKNSVYHAPSVIPSLNAKVVLSKDLDLRLSYARGFRAPALRELYYDFFDASHSIMGNENLKAEESNSFNGSIVWAGVAKQNSQFRSTLSGFYNQFLNRIDYGVNPTDPSITTLINIAKFKTTGISLDNTLMVNNLQVNIGFSYIGRLNSLGADQPSLLLPEFVWSKELSSTVSYYFPKWDGNVSLFYKYAGARPNYQLSSNNGEQSVRLAEVGSFNWADLMITKNLRKNITVNLGVKNLFDITQLANTSTSSGGAHGGGGASVPYSYGRSFAMGIIFSWNKN